MWGTLAENPIARIASEAINRFFTSDPPTFYKVPYGYADAGRIADDLRRGGFRDATFETVNLKGQFVMPGFNDAHAHLASKR